MATDNKTKNDERELERAASADYEREHEREIERAAAQIDVLIALGDVAKAELAKGPGISSNAWRALYDAVARVFGDEALAHASPVVGRQPVVMPPGFKNPIPAKGGATPTRPDQPVIETAADIRKREDVAKEIERVKRGGRP